MSAEKEYDSGSFEGKQNHTIYNLSNVNSSCIHIYAVHYCTFMRYIHKTISNKLSIFVLTIVNLNR